MYRCPHAKNSRSSRGLLAMAVLNCQHDAVPVPTTATVCAIAPEAETHVASTKATDRFLRRAAWGTRGSSRAIVRRLCRPAVGRPPSSHVDVDFAV